MVKVRIVIDKKNMEGKWINGIKGKNLEIGLKNNRGELKEIFEKEKEEWKKKLI